MRPLFRRSGWDGESTGQGNLHSEPSQEPRPHPKVPPVEFQLHVGGRAWGTSSKPGKTLTWKVSASTLPHGDGIPWDSPGDLPQIPLQAQGSGTAALSRSSHGGVQPPSLFIPASLLLLPAGSPPSIPLTRAGAIRKLRPLGLLHPAHSSSHTAAARSGESPATAAGRWSIPGWSWREPHAPDSSSTRPLPTLAPMDILNFSTSIKFVGQPLTVSSYRHSLPVPSSAVHPVPKVCKGKEMGSTSPSTAGRLCQEG